MKGKFPVDVEDENSKQKMEILITERTDVTPLLGMDWMKKFKLPIGRIRLAKDNEKVFNKFPDSFENNGTIKDTEINIQPKQEHYPVKQKARTVSLHPQEDENCFVSPVVITIKATNR